MELARLEVENSELAERLETRKVVERAKGILQRDLGITEEEAYLAIQRQSRQPLISEEVFYRVQGVLSGRVQPTAPRPAQSSGLSASWLRPVLRVREGTDW